MLLSAAENSKLIDSAHKRKPLPTMRAIVGIYRMRRVLARCFEMEIYNCSLEQKESTFAMSSANIMHLQNISIFNVAS